MEPSSICPCPITTPFTEGWHSLRSEINVGDLVQALYYFSTKSPIVISDQREYNLLHELRMAIGLYV
jgi:hypothetical protein